MMERRNPSASQGRFLTRLAHEEHGVYFVFAALLFIGVVGVFIFLGYYAVQSKRASGMLRLAVEEICEEVAYSPGVHARSWETFKRMVKKIELPHATITEAHLYLPTMPENYSDGADCSGSAPPFVGDLEGEECTFAGAKCYFHGDVCDVGAEQRFPSNFWDALQQTGNTAGCQITAQIDSLFGGSTFSISDKIVRANVSWRRSLQNVRPTVIEPGPWTQNPSWIASPYGLTMIIAPHMTTFARAERFRFDGYDPFPESFRTEFDPFWQLGGSKRLAFSQKGSFPNYPFSFPGYGALQASVQSISPLSNIVHRGESDPAPERETDRDEMWTACMNPVVLMRNTFISTILEFAARTSELRTGTEILLAGTKHRLTTDNVDVGLTTDPGLSLFPNPPVQVVAKGEDLLGRTFQAPFVTYFSGAHGGPVTAGGNYIYQAHKYYQSLVLGHSDTSFGVVHGEDLRSGWVMPFSYRDGGYESPVYLPELSPIPDFGGDDDTIRREIVGQVHSMIAGQLRNCFHLHALSPSGIASNFASYAARDLHEENESFEPNQYANKKHLIDVGYPIGHPRWDQRCTTNDGAWSPSGRCSESQDGVNALELARFLGTIQQCPAEIGWDIDDDELLFYLNPPDDVTKACHKPAWRTESSSILHHPSRDLSPDLIGALAFLSGGLTPYRIPSVRCEPDCRLSHTLRAHAAFPALRSPGMFPMRENYHLWSDPGDSSVYSLPPTHVMGSSLAGHLFPFDTALGPNKPYVNKPYASDSSIVMLTTHVPITKTDMPILKELITHLNTPSYGAGNLKLERPVIIVYMPTNLQDVNPAVIDRFQQVLLPTNPTDDEINQLIVLSPYMLQYEDAGYTLDEEDLAYKEYWNDMLDPEVEGNIFDIAENIFNSYLTVLKRKL